MTDPIAHRPRASDAYTDDSRSAGMCRAPASRSESAMPTNSAGDTLLASAPRSTAPDESLSAGATALVAENGGSESPAVRAARVAAAERTDRCQQAAGDTVVQCSAAVAATVATVASASTLVGEFAVGFAARVAIGACWKSVEREQFACQVPASAGEAR